MPADARAGVEDAFDRLLNHANLPGQHAERCSGQQSLAWGFRNASAANLPALAEDLLEALQVVGRHLAAHQSDDSERLRLRAAYAASCALSDGPSVQGEDGLGGAAARPGAGEAGVRPRTAPGR